MLSCEIFGLPCQDLQEEEEGGEPEDYIEGVEEVSDIFTIYHILRRILRRYHLTFLNFQNDNKLKLSTSGIERKQHYDQSRPCMMFV